MIEFICICGNVRKCMENLPTSYCPKCGSEMTREDEDGDNHFSKKEGLLVEVNSTHLILRVSNYDGDRNEGFNLSKILRIEEVIQ